MKNPFTNSSKYFNTKIQDIIKKDEHVKITIEKSIWNSLTERWETKSIEVQEYDIKPFQLIFLSITDRFRVL